MKKLLLSAMLMSSAFAANAQEITFAMEPSYPPFETTNEKGEIIGFDVDVANAICKEIQATCNFKSQSFDALIPSLKAKRFDAAISAMDITEAVSYTHLAKGPPTNPVEMGSHSWDDIVARFEMDEEFKKEFLKEYPQVTKETLTHATVSYTHLFKIG